MDDEQKKEFVEELLSGTSNLFDRMTTTLAIGSVEHSTAMKNYAAAIWNLVDAADTLDRMIEERSEEGEEETP